MDQTELAIRTIIGQFGRLAADAASLDDSSDLYEAGLTSHASVNVMLALEDEFDLEFPERMLRRATFSSIATIRDSILDLVEGQAVA